MEQGCRVKGVAFVCLLDVLVNKASVAYIKQVHAVVREMVEAWQQVRPVMMAVMDEKTGERHGPRCLAVLPGLRSHREWHATPAKVT